MKLFRAENCRDLVFIGTLVRPALSEIGWTGARFACSAGYGRRSAAATIICLSGIGRILEQDGFRMVGIKDVAPDLLMPEGCLTRTAPDENAAADIARGREVLRALSPFDIGQAAVVIDGHVVGVEDIEGTDGLLARVARLRSGRPHPRQGRRAACW